MKKIYTYLLVAFSVLPLASQAQVDTVEVCSGENVCLVAGNYRGAVQWQTSPDLLTWTAIPLATTDTFCIPPVTGYFRAEITEGTCNPVYSDTTWINFIQPGASADTFLVTGAVQFFTVPNCVDSLTITCLGAQGGDVILGGPYSGGLGASMRGTFAVTPGQVLLVVVGEKGNPDDYSSGGGGASGVGDTLNPWIIAGGGAGVDFQDPFYAGIHATIINDGNSGSNASNGGTLGGDGGSTTYSGTHTSFGGRGWNSGFSGSMGQDGIAPNTTSTQGTFGIGGGGGSVGTGWCNCGGGGGGYSGGGSGEINSSGGGGGSYNTGANQLNMGGAHSGSGMVIISY